MKQGKVRVNIGSLDGYIGTTHYGAASIFRVDVAVCNDGSGVILKNEDYKQIALDYRQIDELIEHLRYAKENCRYNRENN